MPVGTVFVDIEQLYKIHCDFVKIFISITYSSIVYWCYFLKPQLWSRNLCLIFCPLLLLLLSRFCHVRLCETPETAAHEAPPSLGFSRQEHWSELPFPSPVLKVESESKVSVVSDSDLTKTLNLTCWEQLVHHSSILLEKKKKIAFCHGYKVT